MLAKRKASRPIAIGTDLIMFGVSLPSGSVLHDVKVDLRMSSGLLQASGTLLMYAVEGWLLPVLDPDAAQNLDTMWDSLVPKDTDVEVVDLDTGAADATPFFEPGEPDFSNLFDVGLRPERIYHYNRLLSISDGAMAIFQDNQTPFSAVWVAGDQRTIRVRKGYRISQPTVLCFGVASPSLDDTDSTIPTALAEEKWGQLKYIGHVLERALLHVFGVIEAGAETPWEEATALLKEILEPDVFETVATIWGAVSWNAAVDVKVDFSVEGRLGQVMLTSGR